MMTVIRKNYNFSQDKVPEGLGAYCITLAEMARIVLPCFCTLLKLSKILRLSDNILSPDIFRDSSIMVTVSG